jgi:hypothetical protein
VSTRTTSSWCATSLTCLGRLQSQEEPARLERNHGELHPKSGEILWGEREKGGGLTISPPMAATSAPAVPSPSPSPQRSPPVVVAARAGGGGEWRAAPAFSRAASDFGFWAERVSAFLWEGRAPDR